MKANKGGWTPLDEAVSYGDRSTIADILRANREKLESAETFKTTRAYAYEALGKMDDFCLEIKWEFHSWSKP